MSMQLQQVSYTNLTLHNNLSYPTNGVQCKTSYTGDKPMKIAPEMFLEMLGNLPNNQCSLLSLMAKVIHTCTCTYSSICWHISPSLSSTCPAFIWATSSFIFRYMARSSCSSLLSSLILSAARTVWQSFENGCGEETLFYVHWTQKFMTMFTKACI